MRTRGFEIVRRYLDQGIHLPKRGTARSAGYDLEAAERVEIPPGGFALVPTGLKAYMLPDEVLEIHIRSSMAVKKGLSLVNSVGIIDGDYYDNPDNEGHIMVVLRNDSPKRVELAKGTRVAQGIFVKYLTIDGDPVSEGEERRGGFGSTGEG